MLIARLNNSVDNKKVFEQRMSDKSDNQSKMKFWNFNTKASENTSNFPRLYLALGAGIQFKAGVLVSLLDG